MWEAIFSYLIIYLFFAFYCFDCILNQNTAVHLSYWVKITLHFVFILKAHICYNGYQIGVCNDILSLPYNIRIKTMFGSSVPPIVCRRAHVLFTLFMFVCVWWRPTHIVLCFCFVFLRLVYVVSFSGLSFFIAPSVLSNIEQKHITWAKWESVILLRERSERVFLYYVSEMRECSFITWAKRECSFIWFLLIMFPLFLCSSLYMSAQISDI